jgi:hypothetical protein
MIQSKTDRPLYYGNLYRKDGGAGYAGAVWSSIGCCPTITTMGGGNRQPLIIEYGESDSDMGVFASP